MDQWNEYDDQATLLEYNTLKELSSDDDYNIVENIKDLKNMA
jgi:hypothetical protein